MTPNPTPPTTPLPCPFCGEPPHAYTNAANTTYVSCRTEGCFGRDFGTPRGHFDVRLDAWNRRALPPARPAEPTSETPVTLRSLWGTVPSLRDPQNDAPLPSGEPTSEAVAWQVVDARGKSVHIAAYLYGMDEAKAECEQWCDKWNAEPPVGGSVVTPCAVRPLYALPVSQQNYDELREKHEALAGHFANLRAQLAAAREDSARLDALERLVLADVENGGEPAALTLIHWGVGENKGWYIGGGIESLPTFRAAIDTARSTDAAHTKETQ